MNKKDLRKNFRESVLKRDDFKCRVCGRSDVKLDAHHICDRSIISNGGYVTSNGITLCDTENGCHIKAEAFYMGLEVEDGYNPDQLYALIGSSYEIAETEASLL